MATQRLDAVTEPQEYKLIVAGGRDFNDPEGLAANLYALAECELGERAVSIVSGMARGADRLAYQFAQRENVKVYEFHADWNRYGRSAGHRRNREMGDFADGLMAFWDGRSVGTKNMIEYMQRMGKDVRVVRY